MVAALLALSACMSLLVQLLRPRYVYGYLVPCLFLLFVIVFSLLIARWRKSLYANKMPIQVFFNYFLMWKMGKMLMSIVIFIVIRKFIAEGFSIFLITFGIFYAVFMPLEIVAIRRVERGYRQLKEKE
jgi:hypothetical protein